MQKILFLITLFSTLGSCSDPALEMERESMECFSEAASNNNVDLDSLIEIIELQLMSEGQLKGDNGHDYITFLEKMNTENKTSHLAEHPSTTTFLFLHKLSVFENCKKRFENKAYTGSTSQKLDNAMSDLALSMNITPKSFSKVFLKSLRKSDFEKRFYKVIFWKAYSGIFISGPDFSELLPLKADNVEKSEASDCPKSDITLTSSDDIIWNDESIDISVLEDSICSFIQESIVNSKKQEDLGDLGIQKTAYYVLHIKASAQTSYGLYIKIQNTVKKSVNRIRNNYSNQFFNKDYLSLDEEQTKLIESVVKEYVLETRLYKD